MNKPLSPIQQLNQSLLMEAFMKMIEQQRRAGYRADDDTEYRRADREASAADRKHQGDREGGE